MNEVAKCQLCGEPMPPGEEMFKFHGYSGPCPKPAKGPKLVRDMTEPELAELGTALGRLVEGALPPGPSNKGKCLFFLCYTDTTEPGVAQYVSNITRPDAVKMLRETADRIERRQDVGR